MYLKDFFSMYVNIYQIKKLRIIKKLDVCTSNRKEKKPESSKLHKNRDRIRQKDRK